MTGPDMSASGESVRFQDTASVAAQFTTRPSDTLPPPPADFGPDADATINGTPFENLETGKARKPRAGHEPKPGRSPLGSFGKLGQNKKPRSPIRRLVPADREKIENLYTFGAMGLMAVRPEAAQIMALSAEKCADAWYELAQENDAVRRALLAIIEGGVWGKVFMAHAPILVALIPQHVLPPQLRNNQMVQAFMNMNNMNADAPETPEAFGE